MEPDSQAPADATEQAQSTPEAVSGQATAAESQEPGTETPFTDLTPENLPPELQDLWSKTHKSLQADYTRKTQEIAAVRQKADAFEELMPYVKDILDGKAPQQAQAQADAPLTGEQLLTRILEDPASLQKMIQDEARKMVEPLANDSAMQKATATYDALVAKYPDLPQYEEQVAEMVTRGYDPEHAYQIATYGKVMQRGIDQGAKAAAKRDAAAAPESSNASVTTGRPIRSFKEAALRAMESTGWGG